MPRERRIDQEGAWHHVFNRGLGKRTVFEDQADVRFFLSRLAHLVRRGVIALHAFVFLTTHYHLLLRSTSGDLSSAMRWAVNQYVRWFNRRRKRDGPLFRGRFGSRHVDCQIYWKVVLRYIDFNPIKAGLVERSSDWRWGSARLLASPRRPLWLSTHEVEQEFCRTHGLATFHPEDYQRGWPVIQGAGVEWLVDQHYRRGQRSGPNLTSLLEAANSSTKSWLRWKGLLADGTRPGEVLIHPETVMSVLHEAEAAGGRWTLHSDRTRLDAYELMAVGLLRKASGLSLREVAGRLKLSPSTARRYLEVHQVRMVEDDVYAHRAMALLSGAGEREVRELLGTSAPGVMR